MNKNWRDYTYTNLPTALIHSIDEELYFMDSSSSLFKTLPMTSAEYKDKTATATYTDIAWSSKQRVTLQDLTINKILHSIGINGKSDIVAESTASLVLTAGTYDSTSDILIVDTDSKISLIGGFEKIFRIFKTRKSASYNTIKIASSSSNAGNIKSIEFYDIEINYKLTAGNRRNL